MEGGGAYNKYARLPAGGAALALPLLEKALRNVTIAAGNAPVIVADYGSSQGKNSLAPMRFVLQNLRPRIGERRPIFVFHVDQPTNDFNSLFEVLSTDTERYALDHPHVFPCAIGRSFYESVLPPETVHLGWSSYAAVWLSHIPKPIPDHFIAVCCTGEVRAAFDRQAAQDWEFFLSLRAKELAPGGRLIVVLPGIGETGSAGFEEIFNTANAVLAEMVQEGALTAEEYTRMTIASHPRRKADLLAPFARNAHFQGLSVEACEEFVLMDAAWADYQRDDDAKALATKRALFFRSVFMPSLAAALTRVRAGDAEAQIAFGNRLEEGLKRRVRHDPTPMHSFVHAIVLAKQSPALRA